MKHTYLGRYGDSFILVVLVDLAKDYWGLLKFPIINCPPKRYLTLKMKCCVKFIAQTFRPPLKKKQLPITLHWLIKHNNQILECNSNVRGGYWNLTTCTRCKLSRPLKCHVTWHKVTWHDTRSRDMHSSLVDWRLWDSENITSIAISMIGLGWEK